MKISIFGSSYVGLVTGASLANLGHEVLCADIDAEKIALLEQGEVPFYEPGLKELVQRTRDKKKLAFTSDLPRAVKFGEVLFNCVGTPSKEDGSADLQSFFVVVEMVADKVDGPNAGSLKVLVNKSTVPPGTARKCQEILNTKHKLVEVVSNPEFLKQGNAVYDFNHPDKVVVGAESEKAFEIMRKVYHGLIRTYIPFLEMNWETAEMVKYANNAFLATKISFINEIANICGEVGADVKLVAKAIGMDLRIGPKFLNAGIGYGGSCFPKDVKALMVVAREQGHKAHLLSAVEEVNKDQKEIFLSKILERLKEVQGDTVTVWGLSFKPKTSDLREAPAVVLISKLFQQGIKIKAYDPVAGEEARKIFGETITYCSSVEESVAQSNVIVLVTEWDEFRNVDFRELGKTMRNRIVFDGRNIYDPDAVREEGFEYIGVGRGGRR